MEESWRGADHTQTSWGAADRCHESMAVIRTARMEGGEAGMERETEEREAQRVGERKENGWFQKLTEEATGMERNVMKRVREEVRSGLHI